MKQNVELYIEGQRIDTFNDGSINITSTLKDIKDPAKVFTDFSRNFTLPASNNNNIIFGHYYKNDIVIGGFDAGYNYEAELEINSRPFRKGYIKLDSVELRNKKPYAYKITFFGSSRLLIQNLSDIKLSDLDYLNGFSFTYQAKDTASTNDVYTRFTTSHNATNSIDSVSYTAPIVVPLITHSERLYYNSSTAFYGVNEDGNLYNDSYPSNTKLNGVKWNQLKPAIRIDVILRAIEKKISTILSDVENDKKITVTFSNNFFNSSNLNYYNLYMWLHRKKGNIVNEDTNPKQKYLIDTFQVKSQVVSTGVSTWTTFAKTFWATFTDPSNEAALYEHKASVLRLNNFGLSGLAVVDITIRLTCYAQTADEDKAFDVVLFKDGFEYRRNTGTAAAGDGSTDDATLTYKYFEFIDLDVEGNYMFYIETDTSLNFNAGGGGAYGFTIEIIPGGDYGLQKTENNALVKNIITAEDTTPFNITEQVPDITVLDFLSGLFKMFNLIAEVNDTSTTTKEIVVKSVDTYYNDSTKVWNLNNRIDQTKSIVEPFRAYDKVKYEYEGRDSILAKQHEEEFGVAWGGEEWSRPSSQERVSGETYELTVPFEHMKFERLIDTNATPNTIKDIQVGFSATMSNKDDTASGGPHKEKYNPYIGKPLLFYPYLHTMASSGNIPYVYRRISDGTMQYLSPATFWMPLNAVGLTRSQSNHFGEEIHEYILSGTGNSGLKSNLFNLYHKNYIKDVFSPKRRIYKYDAHLPVSFLVNYTLADKVEIEGEYYTINSITSNLINGKSKLELIPYLTVESYYCLTASVSLDIQLDSSGNSIYVLNDRIGQYQSGVGSFVLDDVPSSHPIAFHNFGKESVITYTGTSGGTKTGLDGNTYTYYYGDVTVTITGDFGTISYECYNHGYMGGQNNFVYNSSCSETSTIPVPSLGDLTVDSSTITSDDTDITSDQTEK